MYSSPDINGDGSAEIVVGDPFADDARGAIDVQTLSGAETQAPGSLVDMRRITPADVGLTLPAGAQFGAAVTHMHANTDACDDLVVGAPGVSGVYLILGTPSGLSATAISLPSVGRPADRVGSALSTTSNSVIAGAPGRDVNGVRDAGALVRWVLQPSSDATPAIGAPQVITQATRGVGGRPTGGGRFGLVVRSTTAGAGQRIVVGQPDATVNGAARAGAVTTLGMSNSGEVSTSSVTSQDSPGIPGVAEAGDEFGASLAQGLVGAPGEDLGAQADAGMVVDLVRRRGITQDTPGVAGSAEAGDRFGAAVRVFRTYDISDDFAVGVPGEDVDGMVDAGTVTIISVERGKAARLKSSELLQNRTAGWAAPSTAGARFGAVISVVGNGGYEDHGEPVLLVGAPGGRPFSPPLRAGSVFVMGAVDAFHYSFTFGARLPEPNGRYGSVLMTNQYS